MDNRKHLEKHVSDKLVITIFSHDKYIEGPTQLTFHNVTYKIGRYYLYIYSYPKDKNSNSYIFPLKDIIKFGYYTCEEYEYNEY